MNYFCGCQVCQLWMAHHHQGLGKLKIHFSVDTGLEPEVIVKNEEIQFSPKQVFENNTQDGLLNAHIKAKPYFPLQQKIEEINELKKRNNDKRKHDQKEGRNITSNIFRSFFKFLTSIKGQQLLQGFNNQWDSDYRTIDILKFFQSRRLNSKNYIRVAAIRQVLLDDPEEKSHAFISLFTLYLKKYVRLHFLNSKKIKKESKRAILSEIRNLQNQFTSRIIGTLRQKQNY